MESEGPPGKHDGEEQHDRLEENNESDDQEVFHDAPRALPVDLPRTLDDRQNFQSFSQETEYYDAWQGQSQFLQAPVMAKPLSFNLSLHEPDDSSDFAADFGNDDARVAHMFAAKALQSEGDPGEVEEDQVLLDKRLSRAQKSQALQELLFMAVSNGDAQRVLRLVRGQSADLVQLDGVDGEGTPPLVYASCFGHRDVVLALLNAGAQVDTQDRNQWTALMWAMTNRHKDIAKILLDHGASTDVKSSSGRTALDFVSPNSDMSDFLQHEGYSIGNAGVTEDFYNSGLSQDRLEEELAESEMRRRMMMESAINLEVDLGNLGLDEHPEPPEELEDRQEFVWDRCLHDQMFVFMEGDIQRILDVVITNMTPQRSPSQKPVPANLIFLGARYAHYYASKELLANWLESAQDRIFAVIDRHQWDMTILAFWISNATLLLYYLKKDTGLAEVTGQFQVQMAELIHEIYILIIRDAERRMEKLLDPAILDHETIPGFEEIHFRDEWKFLRSKSRVKPEPAEKHFRPPSPKRKAQVAPRNITSMASSALFVLDLYDVHSVIIAQILSQIYYWLGAELFNRILSNKKYLARSKAMQIRMNVSVLEDWARGNNRQPEHYENGMTTPAGDATVDLARRHLAPAVQLLQWLQCFSSLNEDKEAIESTLQQLPSLSAKQLLHAVKYYRAEAGEQRLSKAASRSIQEIKTQQKRRTVEIAQTLAPQAGGAANGHASLGVPGSQLVADEEDAPNGTLLNSAILLPFHLPTSTDMLVTFGAGFGGLDRERERRYIPSVPPEILAKLDPGEKQGDSHIYDGAQFSSDTGSEKNAGS